MRKITIENPNEAYTDENAGLMAAATSATVEFEREAETFDEYTQKVQEKIPKKFVLGILCFVL